MHWLLIWLEFFLWLSSSESWNWNLLVECSTSHFTTYCVILIHLTNRHLLWMRHLLLFRTVIFLCHFYLIVIIKRQIFKIFTTFNDLLAVHAIASYMSRPRIHIEIGKILVCSNIINTSFFRFVLKGHLPWL